MKNHWLQEQTERLKPILTLITDKVIKHGRMMDAHRANMWHSTKDKEDYKMTGIFERIAKVSYHKCFHTKYEKKCSFDPPILGEDLYDHTMRFFWKEPFGHGHAPETDFAKVCKDSMTQGPSGNWYMPCDLWFWITLWHPSQQDFQEGLAEYWNYKERVNWRPKYHYTEEDVEAALKIMVDTFGWEYERDSDGKYWYT